MPVRRRVRAAPDHLEFAELIDRDPSTLVFLPDAISPVDGEMVAAFRERAQALKVGAKNAGVTVEFMAPAGVRVGVYSEHAADWVLPLILGVPGATVATLLATQIQGWLDEWRKKG